VTTVDADAATTVRRYIEALNCGDADQIAACVSDEFVNEHVSSLGATIVGRAAYRDRLGPFLSTFRALRYDVEQLIVDGCQVAVAYRMSASWHESGCDDSCGRPVALRGMFRFKVESGRITHRADYWDSADFLRQVRHPELKV